jgi:DnaA family protein
VNTQLPLAFKAGTDHRFIDFLGQDALRQVFEQAAEGKVAHHIFLVGASGAGKTHLLRASASHALALGQNAAYVPLTRAAGMLAEVLEGLRGLALVCLDDVQALAGKPDAEEALFHFYNRADAEGMRLLFTATAMPAQLGITLPDLVSRLEQGLRLHAEVLDEHGKRRVLQRRAAGRGLQMDEAVLDYLFSRVSRDLHALSQLLDRLDHASLAAQRRLTVPFIKSVLNSAD